MWCNREKERVRRGKIGEKERGLKKDWRWRRSDGEGGGVFFFFLPSHIYLF